MTPETALDVFRQALITALLIASPMLGVGLAVGLAISILQAVTQIHEMTLTFIPKMVGVVLALLIALPWMMKLMLHYAGTLFGGLGAFA
jgi:flagellar biosynthetic protein FliQ